VFIVSIVRYVKWFHQGSHVCHIICHRALMTTCGGFLIYLGHPLHYTSIGLLINLSAKRVAFFWFEYLITNDGTLSINQVCLVYEFSLFLKE